MAGEGQIAIHFFSRHEQYSIALEPGVSKQTPASRLFCNSNAQLSYDGPDGPSSACVCQCLRQASGLRHVSSGATYRAIDLNEIHCSCWAATRTSATPGQLPDQAKRKEPQGQFERSRPKGQAGPKRDVFSARGRLSHRRRLGMLYLDQTQVGKACATGPANPAGATSGVYLVGG